MDTPLPSLTTQILDNLSTWVYVKQSDGRYVYANRSMCEALALSRLAIAGQTDQSLFKHRAVLEGQPQSLEDPTQSIDPLMAAGQSRVELLTLRSGEQLTMRTRVLKTSHLDGYGDASVWISEPVVAKGDFSAPLVEDLNKLHTLFDNTEAHLYIKDENKRYRYVNPPVAEFLGRQIKDIIGKNDYEIFSPEAADQLNRNDAPVYDLHIPLKVEEHITAPHGDTRTFVSVKMPWRNSRGRIELLGISTDITELIRTRLFESLRTAVLESIAQGKPLRETLALLIQRAESLNSGVRCSILLRNPDGKSLGRAIAPSMPDGFAEAVEGMAVQKDMGSCGAAVAIGEPIFVEDTATHPNWALFRDFARQMSIAACWSQPIKDADDHILGALAFHHRQPARPSMLQKDELDKLGKLAGIAIARSYDQDQVRTFAYRDPLTGLLNRRALDQRIQETLVLCKQNKSHAALILLDLDNFKPLNDQHGHQAGDELLVQVSQRLLEIVRETDSVARIGGDEFVVLANNLDPDRGHALIAAQAIADKLRVDLAQPYFVEIKSSRSKPMMVEHHCSASLGVKLIDSQTSSTVEALMAADKAMYRAKANGRNRVECADQ